MYDLQKCWIAIFKSLRYWSVSIAPRLLRLLKGEATFTQTNNKIRHTYL